MTASNRVGAPCWIEVFTDDTAAVARFYTDLLGWTADEPDPAYGGYFLLRRDGEPVAGVMHDDGSSGAPHGWLVYLETDDVAALAARAVAAGGQVVTGPMQVGPLGHMATVVDPAGARVGAWQPGLHQGFAVRGEVGAPTWFETLSTDYDRCVSFYADVFGWETHTLSDTPELRYTTLGEGQDALAGIMDGSEALQGGPATWQFYLAVADTDATQAAAEAGGARTLLAAQNSPHGRLALLEDPTGVRFAVMGPVIGR